MRAVMGGRHRDGGECACARAYRSSEDERAAVLGCVSACGGKCDDKIGPVIVAVSAEQRSGPGRACIEISIKPVVCWGGPSFEGRTRLEDGTTPSQDVVGGFVSVVLRLDAEPVALGSREVELVAVEPSAQGVAAFNR